MELIGKVIVVGNTEEVGTNGFTKRQLVIETQEQYPQKIPMDFVKEKTSLLDNVQVGNTVKVGINLRGSEYQGKFYVNINAWKIELVGEQQPAF